jgi:hypothetical protein
MQLQNFSQSQKGAFIGFGIGLLIVISMLLTCDRNCGESPIYLTFPFILIGLMIIGFLWRSLIFRIFLYISIGIYALIGIINMMNNGVSW